MSLPDETIEAVWTAMCAGDTATLDEISLRHPNFEDHTPDLFDAIGVCPFETIQWFVDFGSLSRKADDGYSVLHCAIERAKPDREKVVRLLVSHGADLNEWGVSGTPLHRAALLDDNKMVHLLLDLGADPTKSDPAYGGTAEERASRTSPRGAQAIRDWIAQNKKG